MSHSSLDADADVEPWLLHDSDVSVLDVDHMTKTLSAIKAKNVRPDLFSSVVSHYASNWLPEVLSSPATSTATWIKKRSLVEALVCLLPPPEGDAEPPPCDFLLKLLRAACMVGAGATYLDDLETRVARQLEQASLRELTIPAFSHTCDTLLDLRLVLRLVRKFVALDEAAAAAAAGRNRTAAMAKVAKLVDSYLAEAATDAELAVSDFEELAKAVPGHARATDDGLYRAVDTYLKAHPSIAKQDRKALSRLIDPRKLTPEASLHAVHSDRLPIRCVVQILFSEQSKLNRITEGSAGRPFSPNLAFELPGGRCPSKRHVLAQQQEVRRLQEDVARLYAQCRTLQAQIDMLVSEKKKKKGFSKWSTFLFSSDDSIDIAAADDYDVGLERQTPRTPKDVNKTRPVQGKMTPRKWRNSVS